jgi:menaquinone-dependent protoporphyrinogen IX oxidase
MVGGAIMYRQYSQRQQIIFRLMMLLLGGPTDLSQDHDLTDWASVHQFIKEFLDSFSQPTSFR